MNGYCARYAEGNSLCSVQCPQCEGHPDPDTPPEPFEILLRAIEKQGDKAYEDGMYTVGIRIREATKQLRALQLGALVADLAARADTYEDASSRTRCTWCDAYWPYSGKQYEEHHEPHCLVLRARAAVQVTP